MRVKGLLLQELNSFRLKSVQNFSEFSPRFAELVKRRYMRAVKKGTIVRVLSYLRSVQIESVKGS